MNSTPVLRARVAAKQAETDDITAFELRGADGQALPGFSAGAHVLVQLPSGLARAYSLCNAPGELDRYLLAVRRSPVSRGGSQAMHDKVAAGDVLTISAPRNLFPLAPQARHSVLVAAGIGITPLLSMAEHLWATGASFELHYVARSRAAAAFLTRIEASPFGERLRLHLHDAGAANASAAQPALDLAALLPAPGFEHHLYCCGPANFMDAVQISARARGWTPAHFHQEHFGAVDHAADTTKDGSFELRLARSQCSVRVGPQESATQALARAGIVVPTSCEQGVCGTCLTRVLDGEPDHRDLFLTPQEQAGSDQFLPCCSRARSAHLTLDL